MPNKTAVPPRLQQIYLGAERLFIKRAEEVLRPQLRPIANVFYAELLAHPDSAAFLDNQLVAARLSNAFEDWLGRLFLPRTKADIIAFVEYQRAIGRVHARIDVPMHLVMEGMRVMRREIGEHLFKSDMSRGDVVHALICINDLLDFAASTMNDTYVTNIMEQERNLRSLRTHLSPHNLIIEIERMRSFLFDWHRQFVVTAFEAGRGKTFRWRAIERSEFGLWAGHRVGLLLGDMAELRDLERAIGEIAAACRAASHARSTEDFRTAMAGVDSAVTQAAWTLAGMVTKTKELEDIRDPLTNLFNRRYLPTVLKHETSLAAKHQTPFGILVLDIDRFKGINDCHGHDGGDEVLRQFAEVLANSIRANDFLFRYGGEEYLVVLGNIDEMILMQVAEKLRNAVAQHAFRLVDGTVVPVTTSIGAAVHDGHLDYGRTITRADKALYEAKGSGRNRCVLFATAHAA